MEHLLQLKPLTKEHYLKPQLLIRDSKEEIKGDEEGRGNLGSMPKNFNIASSGQKTQDNDEDDKDAEKAREPKHGDGQNNHQPNPPKANATTNAPAATNETSVQNPAAGQITDPNANHA